MSRSRGSAAPPARSRDLPLRAAAIAVSLGLVVLWVVFPLEIFSGARGMPAPGGLVVPALFCGLALAGAAAAWKGEGVAVALTGGLSLVPGGFVLGLIPGPTRWIALGDVLLIALGVLLVRSHTRAARARPLDREG